MKKAGRRVVDRFVTQAVVTRELMLDMADDDDIKTLVTKHLEPCPGDATTRLNIVTGKYERWVLIRPVGPATDLYGDQHRDDLLTNSVRFMRKQRWEAAFVTSVLTR